jgi:hypothetical protein
MQLAGRQRKILAVKMDVKYDNFLARVCVGGSKKRDFDFNYYGSNT